MGKNIKAVWQGDFKQGSGKLQIDKSVLNEVAFKPSFAKSDDAFTNPEELLASAHASCYSMTLSYILSEIGIDVDSLETNISLTIENNIVKSSNIDLKAKITDLDDDRFRNWH